jgi:hypothetical protein
MQLYLQFGYGMMEHTAALLSEWGGGAVILSPRDLDREQLERTGKKTIKSGAEVLLDPQCFVRDANHSRLTAHEYWQVFQQTSTGSLGTPEGARAVLDAVFAVNAAAGTERTIVPGVLARPVTAEWLALHRQLVEVAGTMASPRTIIATIALSEESVRSEDEVEAVVDAVSRWDCGGVYLICEAPGAYLVDDPIWLANALILAAGLKMGGKTTIVGYANHQLLCLAAARADAIAAGTWLNVRAFPTEKFYNRDEDEVSRRAAGGWYYCPQALAEYKLVFLDIARRNGVLDLMRPDPALGSSYGDALFLGAPPSSVKWGESNAFRHYLTCLRSQCAAVTRASFVGAMAAQEASLNTARGLLAQLSAAGVRGQDRDFSDYVDVNQAALATLDMSVGARLRKSW